MAWAAFHKYTRHVPETGQRELCETRKYYAFYTDYRGKVRKVPGFADKRQTEIFAAQLERDHIDIRLGLRPVPVPGPRRRKHDAPGTSAPMCLPILLEEFLAHVAGKASAGRAKLLRVRLARLLDGLTNIEQITTELIERRVAGFDLARRTRNHYLGHVRQFTRWLVRKKRLLARCPLDDLELPTVRPADRRHIRRAEGVDFLGQLAASVREVGATHYRMVAEARVWLYAVAAATGLRAGELSALIPSDFHLDAPPCHVVLPGGRDGRRLTKNGEDVVLPIDAGLAAGLRGFLTSRPAGERVWPGRWAEHRQAGKMLQRDLAAAGLAYKDERGRVFDFHALRSTYITAFGRTGAPAGHVQKAARHSDPKLTFNTYTDTLLGELATYADKMNLGRAFRPLGPSQPVSHTTVPQMETVERASDREPPEFIEVDW